MAKNKNNYDYWTKLKDVEKWFERINKYDPGRDIALDLVRNFDPDTLLEIGTGGGKDYVAFRDRLVDCSYSGVDVSAKIVDGLKLRYPEINMHTANLNDGLPFEDRSFDVVYVRHVLVHCPYYQEPLKEMVRVADKAVVIVLYKVLRKGPDVREYYNNKNDNRFNRKKFLEFASSLGDLELVPQGIKNREIVVVKV